MNYVAVRALDAFFLESICTGAISHDAKFLGDDIKRVIAKYDFLTVCALVTDNTSANKIMWAILEPEFSRIFYSWLCSACAPFVDP